MAVNERSFIRITPEGAGDRIGFYHTWDIEYSTKTGAFNVGDTIVGSNSGVQAIVIKDTVDNITADAGVLSTLLLTGYENKTHEVGETLNVLGVPQATVVDRYCVYINETTLVGGNNPKYKQSIDAEGQAYVRFGEGAPQFDAFGKLQVSQAVTIGEHILEYDEHPDDFTDLITASASIAHQPDHSGMLMSVGTGATDKVERISNRYFRYQAGKSQLIEITCASGDQGKANVKRKWGYGDNNDGVFFQLDGTQMQIMVRSSVTGSVVSTYVNQEDWNGDVLDGHGDAHNISGHLLDVSKDNIYWIDFQWLGAGRIRYGVIIDGVRITCHSINNANNNGLPYMRTGTLPMYAELENTGVSASGSEFRIWCMVVKTEGSYEPPLKHFSGSVSGVTVTSANCLVSFRSKQTFKGKDNRITAYGEELDVFSSTEPVLIELVKNGTLGGSPTWAVDPSSDSSVEIDTAATTVTGGTVIHSFMVAAGDCDKVDLRNVFSHDGEGMSRKAVIATDPDHYSVRVTRLGGTTTDVSIVANWNEAQ